MVRSLDGKVVLGDTERGLGSDVDRRLMRELRSHADVILVGAGTLRASGASPRLNDAALEARRTARGQPATPTSAVLSASGDLPLERPFFTARDFEALVYLAHGAGAERHAAAAATGRRVVALPPGDPAPALLRHARHELGARLLLCEGGPSLNGALLAEGALDELFLTVGPSVVGGADALTAVVGLHTPRIADATRLSLLSASAHPDSGELYLRYRVLPHV